MDCAERPSLSTAQMAVESVELLARKIKKRTAQKAEHDHGKQAACCKVAHQFWTKRKQIFPPRKTKRSDNPCRNPAGDLFVLEKIDNDAEQAEHPSCGNQAA